MAANEEQDTKWIKIKDATTMASCENILFSDGKTKLLDFIRALEKPEDLKRFLLNMTDVNVHLPSDSLLWPGSTLLHLAVMYSEYLKSEKEAANMVNQLLAQGASVQAQDQRGATPLHLAFKLEQQPLITILLRILEKQSGKTANLIDNDSLSYLHIACSAMDHRNSLARKLLSSDEYIRNTVNVVYKGKALYNLKPGWTPLHVAIDQNHQYLVELLLQHGAIIMRKDDQDFTTLYHLLGTNGRKAVVDLLFDSEQLEDCVDEGVGLRQLLHLAAWFDNTKFVKKLLDAGVDIETTIDSLPDKSLGEFKGSTALHLAATKLLRHAETAKMLLERGANILAKKLNGTTAISMILSCKNMELRKKFVLLLWTDDKLRDLLEKELGLTRLYVACCINDVEQLNNLMDKGINVNANLNDYPNCWVGYTPLHVLVDSYDHRQTSKNFMAVFEKLLQSGCDIDQQDSSGKTALHLALEPPRYWSPHTIVVTALLSAGADINITDRNDKSPISYFVANRLRGYIFGDNVYLMKTLLDIVHKMKLTGIEVSKPNETICATAMRRFDMADNIGQESAFWDQVQNTEKVIIGQRGLTLRSFLCETGAISMYPSLMPADRAEISSFFQSFTSKSSLHWKFLLNLQYRKAVARLSLIGPATEALKDLISPNFPDLCIDIILKYLPNSQLKKLIAASLLNDS